MSEIFYYFVETLCWNIDGFNLYLFARRNVVPNVIMYVTDIIENQHFKM